MRLSYCRISAPMRGETRDLAEGSPAMHTLERRGRKSTQRGRALWEPRRGLRRKRTSPAARSWPSGPGPVRNQSAASSTPSQCSVMAARAPKTPPQVCFTDFLCFLLTLLTCGGIWIRRLLISDSVQKGRQYIGKYSPYESTTSTFIIKDMITNSG